MNSADKEKKKKWFDERAQMNLIEKIPLLIIGALLILALFISYSR